MSAREQPKLIGRRCQCCGCAEHFNGERGFDRHRIGAYGVKRRCLSAVKTTALGWHRSAVGFWTVHPLGSARGARVWPAQVDPLLLPYPESNAPDLHAAAAGAP